MTTIVNNPGNAGEGSGTAVIVGVLVAIVAVVLFFVYGLPALRSNAEGKNDTTNINVQLPTSGTSVTPPYTP